MDAHKRDFREEGMSPFTKAAFYEILSGIGVFGAVTEILP